MFSVIWKLPDSLYTSLLELVWILKRPGNEIRKHQLYKYGIAVSRLDRDVSATIRLASPAALKALVMITYRFYYITDDFV